MCTQLVLEQHNFPYEQPVKKKKNKKKGSNNVLTESNNIPASPESVSSESGSATGYIVNSDTGKSVTWSIYSTAVKV